MRKNSFRHGELTSTDENAEARAADVSFEGETLVVRLRDGRIVRAPLSWYPRLERATPEQRERWELSGAGSGIHWPEIDEDLSTEGLLRGARAPRGSEDFRSPFVDWGAR
jgi:hypothetical protein